MKKGILLLAVLQIGLAASAQIKYKGFVESGASVIVGKYDGETYQLSTSHGIMHGHFYYGLGIGYDIYSVRNPDYNPEPQKRSVVQQNFPLYLDVRGFFLESNRISPVIIMKAGGSIFSDAQPAYLCELGLGGRARLSDRMGLSASVFYRYHNIGYADDAIIFGNKVSNTGIKVSFDF